MAWLRRVFAGLSALVHQSRTEHELDSELQAFLDEAIEEQVLSGMSREAATRLAERQLGNVGSIKERVRDVGWESIVENCWRDARYAVRMLRRSPGFTAVTILTLSLGIGGTTTIFSVLNGLLLKPLPVNSPDELIVISTDEGGAVDLSYPAWKEIRANRLLPHAFAWATDRLSLTDTAELRFVQVIWAAGDELDVLGVPAAMGRSIEPRDDRPGGGPDGPVAVISHAFWERRFAGSRDVVGRTLIVERVPFTIVGVMPADFFGLDVGASFDIMLPLATEPLLGRIPERLESPTWPWLNVMARLGPHQTPASITAILQSAQGRIRTATMPAFDHEEDRDGYLRARWTARSAPGGVSRFRQRYEVALLTLLCIAGLVLLVACATIATLVLARAGARRQEFALRQALGAGRVRIIRQLLVESLLLSVAGATLGVVIARWGGGWLVAQLSTWAADAFLDLSIDWRVLAVTVAATVGTALAFGFVPAFQSANASAGEALTAQGRAVAGDGSARFVGALVILQVAISLVLIVGAALFLRSFTTLAYRDLGFDRSRVLVAVVDARRSKVPITHRLDLYERVRAAAASVRGAESAALSLATPLGSAGIRFTPDFSVPGETATGGRAVRVLTTPVSSGWFRTFGTRLLAGRDFNPGDGVGGRGVAIVNEAFARRYLDGNSLGAIIVEEASPTDHRPLEVVGVVEDAAFTTVREPVEPSVYKPLAQQLSPGLLTTFPTISVSVRTVDGVMPELLSDAVARAIAEVDPELTVFNQTVTLQMHHLYTRERLLASVSVFFGVLAVLLAAMGLYGVTAYSVRMRRKEIGIRMALGADGARVLRMILERVTWCIASGVVAGAVLSLWAAGLVRALLFEVDPRDPLAFAGAAGLLALVGAIAGWLPARRASGIDPAVVLRED